MVRITPPSLCITGVVSPISPCLTPLGYQYRQDFQIKVATASFKSLQIEADVPTQANRAFVTEKFTELSSPLFVDEFSKVTKTFDPTSDTLQGNNTHWHYRNFYHLPSVTGQIGQRLDGVKKNLPHID